MKLLKSFVSRRLTRPPATFFQSDDLASRRHRGTHARLQNNSIAGMTEATGWHYHTCEMQFVYVLKGKLTIEFEDGTVATFTAGDSFFIPGGVRHNEIYVSEDKEALEVSVPGKIGTVNVERPAGLPEKLREVSNERL